MRIRKEILDADKILSEASKELSFSIINPINEPYVRKKFLKNELKNPILKYDSPIKNLLELRRKVSSISIEEKSILDSLIIEKQHDVIRKIDLLNSVGCFDFTERCIKIYGKPDKKLIDKSYDILNEKIVDEKLEKIHSDESVKKIRENLKLYDLKYKIIRKDLVTDCSIESPSKELILKKGRRYSKKFLNRLIIHEIGTHAFRYENGAQQKLSIFKNGLANYLETEEGLAAYNEERFGLLSQKTLRNYAGRVVSVNLALNNGFYKTYKELKKHFEKNTAFKLTLRSKRGLTNTEYSGGYTKDMVYLKGYYDVKRFIKNNNDLNDLYYGKIGLNDVKHTKSLNLKKPLYLPDQFVLFD